MGEKSQLAEDVFSDGSLPHSYCKRQQNWPSDGDCPSVSRQVLLSILPGVANLLGQGDKCLGEVIMASVYFAPPAIFLQRKCFLLKRPVYLLRHLDNLPSLKTYGRCHGHICRPVFAEVMRCGAISLEELWAWLKASLLWFPSSQSHIMVENCDPEAKLSLKPK